MTEEVKAALLKVADDIQEAFRYTGGQVYASRIRSIVGDGRRVIAFPQPGDGTSRL